MEHSLDHDPAEYPRVLGRTITYLHRQKIKFMNDHLKEYELFGAMHMIINYVGRHPGTSQDAIVSNMNIDKCTVARRTKRLEELGYLYRETDAIDRRQNNLYLTDKGEEILPSIRKYLMQWSEVVSQKLAPEERDTLISLLEKIVDTCKEIEN